MTDECPDIRCDPNARRYILQILDKDGDLLEVPIVIEENKR